MLRVPLVSTNASADYSIFVLAYRVFTYSAKMMSVCGHFGCGRKHEKHNKQTQEAAACELALQPGSCRKIYHAVYENCFGFLHLAFAVLATSSIARSCSRAPFPSSTSMTHLDKVCLYLGYIHSPLAPAVEESGAKNKNASLCDSHRYSNS